MLAAKPVAAAPAVIAVIDLTKDYHLAANVVHALRAINNGRIVVPKDEDFAV